MRLVLIADGLAREWPVLKALSENYPDITWIQPRYDLPDPEAAEKPSPPLTTRLGKFYRFKRDGFRNRIMKRRMKGEQFQFAERIEFPWYELDRLKGLELLGELNPDVLITCRAPLLSDRALQTANWCGINVHFGIIPEYRGNEGIFWACMKKDGQGLGGSIHLLDSGVDTGNLLAYSFPELKGNESLSTIEKKVSHGLSEALLETLNRIEELKAAPEGKPQAITGRNYFSKERNFWKDLLFVFRHQLAGFPSQKERFRYFLACCSQLLVDWSAILAC